MRTFALVSVWGASAGLGALLIFLLLFSEPLLFGETGGTILSLRWDPPAGHYGLIPMVAGTLAIALLATAIAFLGALAAALSFTAMGSGFLKTLQYRLLMLFGAIPTVVYGLVGVLILVPWLREYLVEGSGWSVLSAGVMLALVIWPTMVLYLIDSFRSTPPELASLTSALGGRSVDYRIRVLLPFHRRSIGVALAMGLSRAMGDTMIALMLSGNSIQIPHSLSDSTRALTAHIALLFAGEFDSPAFRSIFVSGLILLALSTLLLGVIVRMRRDHAR